LQHFTEFVRDEDDPRSTIAQRPHEVEKLLALSRLKGSGRLVEEEEAGTYPQRPDDLHELALGGVEGRRLPPHVDVDPEVVEQGRGGLPRPAEVDQSEPARKGPAGLDVLGDRPFREQLVVLMDDSHSSRLSLPGGTQSNLATVYQRGPAVRECGAGQNFDEGAFTSTVLSEQRDDLTGRDVEVHPV
jgi:hypothetical protein